MNNIDARIAELVMGEAEPTHDPLWMDVKSDGGNWTCVFRRCSEPHDVIWKPRPFSTDLDQAIRSVDRFFDDRDMDIIIGYKPRNEKGPFWAMTTAPDSRLLPAMYGSTAPEAICKLLLALAEEANASR